MKKRDYYFDNGKFFLIFFVVFGHLIRTFIEDNDIFYSLYKTIYTFHMPAFILISGHFAKGYINKGYTWSLIKKLLFPYLIFQLIYTIYYYFLLDQSTLSISLFDPQWSLWYLISLFCWNLMLPFFTKMHPAISLLLAFAIGISSGYVEIIDNYLSLSRTFVFFPFFLLGYFVRRDVFTKLQSKKTILPASLMISGMFLFFMFYPNIDYEWLLGSKPYAQMDVVVSIAALQRLIIYFISLAMVFSFFAIVPKKKYSFTKIGKYSLYVYLLHGFIIKYFRESALEEWIQEHHAIWILVVASLLLTLILSSSFVRTIMQPFVEIKVKNMRILLKQWSSKISP